MHKLILPLLMLTCIIASATVPVADASTQSPAVYDAQLAEQLGADDYGMKSYVLVVLLTGPNEITDEQQRKSLFAGHFANMQRLAEQQLLVLAGPLVDAKPQRGLFILNVQDLTEAEKLVNSDPAVKAGIFSYQLSKFYGSAALMQINQIHQSIQKNAIE